MTVFAVLTTIFFIISVISLITSLYFKYFKKNKKLAGQLQTATIIFIVYFFISGLISAMTHDPIPYFDIVFWVGLFVGGTVLALTYPDFIAREVKKELIPEPITYRELSLQNAKKEIEAYLEHKKGNTYIDDVINDLRIDPRIVVEVIQKFHKEGKIEEAK